MARILVIDDDVQVRSMLRQLLERAGYEVLEAPDGKDGLKLHRQDPTDLVITDLIMPEKEGIETIMEFRRDFPDVRIIAISGGGSVEPTDYLHTAKAIGARRTLSKPFELREMLKLVTEVLEDGN